MNFLNNTDPVLFTSTMLKIDPVTDIQISQISFYFKFGAFNKFSSCNLTNH